MVQIWQRNDPVRLFWRRLFMLVLIVFVIFGLWAVLGVYAKDRESGELRKHAEVELHDLEKRETALNTRISGLETTRGQEEALRNAYEVGREGEGMVVIVDKPATETPKEEQQLTWFQRLFHWW